MNDKSLQPVLDSSVGYGTIVEPYEPLQCAMSSTGRHSKATAVQQKIYGGFLFLLCQISILQWPPIEHTRFNMSIQLLVTSIPTDRVGITNSGSYI